MKILSKKIFYVCVKLFFNLVFKLKNNFILAIVIIHVTSRVIYNDRQEIIVHLICANKGKKIILQFSFSFWRETIII